VVGYAFRDHWMWFNGYSYLGRTFSFVIWKDYNCVAWISIDDSTFGQPKFDGPVGSKFLQMLMTLYTAGKMINTYNDIWYFG
jgi:hypothetical protein